MIDKWLSSSGAHHNYQMATLPLSYRQLCRTMQHGVWNINEPWSVPRWWDSESTRILWPTTTVCQNLICRWWYPATLLLGNSRSKPLLTAALKCVCMQCSFHCFVHEEENNNIKKMLIQPTRCTEVTRTITTAQTAPKMFQVIQLLLVSLCFSFCAAQIFQSYW
jgi:hypothetical protein